MWVSGKDRWLQRESGVYALNGRNCRNLNGSGATFFVSFAQCTVNQWENFSPPRCATVVEDLLSLLRTGFRCRAHRAAGSRLSRTRRARAPQHRAAVGCSGSAAPAAAASAAGRAAGTHQSPKTHSCVSTVSAPAAPTLPPRAAPPDTPHPLGNGRNTARRRGRAPRRASGGWGH